MRPSLHSVMIDSLTKLIPREREKEREGNHLVRHASCLFQREGERGGEREWTCMYETARYSHRGTLPSRRICIESE